MSVYEKDGMCFHAAGCEPLRIMDQDSADSLLLANKDKFAGYVRIHHRPEAVVFARLGTSTFRASGFSCHIFCTELPKVGPEDEDSEDDEDGGGLFYTDTLPRPGGHMTGYLRPGRGQGFLDEAELALFREVDAADIFQGGLGDCWLLSAFAAMAEFPDPLMSLFKQRSLSENGAYDITLYNFIERRWQTICIDDRLPVTLRCCKAPQAAYVRPTADGEIWTCLLEKAFATLFDNSYNTLNGGVPTTAFASLCGVNGDGLAYVARAGSKAEDGWIILRPVLDSWYPYQEHNFQFGTWPDGSSGGTVKSTAEMFEIVKSWDANNYIMACGTNAGSDTMINSQGIVYGHAYTLLGVADNAWGTHAQLVQLRNPWGQKEWSGDWSDNSPLWDEYPKAKEMLNPEASEDGAFWMPLADFAENYQGIAVVFKDMGMNAEKCINPKAIYPRPRVAGPGIDWPRKAEKLTARRRKRYKAEEAVIDDYTQNMGRCPLS